MGIIQGTVLLSGRFDIACQGRQGYRSGFVSDPVVFDRPMQDGSWSFVVDRRELPEVVGKPAYDASRTIWTIDIRLQPERTFRFMLNSERYKGFRSADNVPLDPVTVRFQTGQPRPEKKP